MNEQEIYNWKMKGLAKGVSPSDAVNELRRIENLYGSLTPENILKASTPKKAVLHNIFEWDKDKAAYNYNLQQARVILNNIQITVISDGESKKVDVYEVTSINEGYKNIDSFSPSDIEYVRLTTLNNLNSLKNKLKIYKEFEKVIEYINQAIEVI